jgi:quercetin dioxygenase-like cupin family protein
LISEELMQVTTQDRILALASDTGEALWWFDGLATLKVTGEHSGGLFSLIEMVRPPNAEIPLHVHHREDELFYLIDGELEARVGDRTIHGKAGSTIFAPREIPHAIRVGPHRAVHYLLLYTPAGFEGFIRDTSKPARELTLPPPPDAPPTPTQMQALSEMMRDRYGCEWVDSLT